MSLIVGRVFGGQIYLLSETELTASVSKRKSHPVFAGWLKLYRLNDTLALAFAGNTEDFARVFPKLAAAHSASEIAAIAARAQRIGSDFDILIAQVGYPKLIKVRNGTVAESESAYIGDHSAFNEFQRRFHGDQRGPDLPTATATFGMTRIPEPVPAHADMYGKMFDAFASIVNDPKIKGVGGIIVPLCTHHGRFSYMEYTRVFTASLNLEFVSDDWEVIPFGTAQDGGYAVELCQGGPSKPDELGFYVLQGRFGIIFPRRSDGIRCAEIIRNVDPADWGVRAYRELSCSFASCFLTPLASMHAGEQALTEERDHDAVVLFELRDWRGVFIENAMMHDRYIAGYATALFNSQQPLRALTVLNEWLGRNIAPSCANLLFRLLAEVSRNRFTHPRSLRKQATAPASHS